MENFEYKSEKEQYDLPDVVFIDDGSTGLKVAYFDKEGELILNTVSNNAELGESYTEGSDTYCVEDGESYTFYPACDALKTKNFHFQYSPHALASVHHALHSLGFKGEVNIVVTLPIKEFFKAKKKNIENINKKKAALLKKVTPESGEPITIRSVKVMPEAIPALADLLLDKEGNRTVTINDYSVVFDFGGNSLDCVIFAGYAQTIISAESFSTGMIEAYDLIKKDLGKEIRAGHLRELLETGQCLGGKFTIDRIKVTKPIIDRAVNQIIDFMTDTISADFLSNVFVLGGGAELLAPALREKGFDAKIVSDPTLALVTSIAKLDKGR